MRAPCAINSWYESVVWTRLKRLGYVGSPRTGGCNYMRQVANMTGVGRLVVAINNVLNIIDRFLETFLWRQKELAMRKVSKTVCTNHKGMTGIPYASIHHSAMLYMFADKWNGSFLASQDCQVLAPPIGRLGAHRLEQKRASSSGLVTTSQARTRIPSR